MTQLFRCDPCLRHTRYKEAKELKERLTAWSLRVAEYELRFKEIDEAQKTFVVRQVMPKDIKREFFTGPTKFDEVMDKLEIIINEMMADDGPVPMDLGNEMSVCTMRRRHRVIRTRAATCHTKTCAQSLGKGTKLARQRARKDRTDRRCDIVDKELMNGGVGEEKKGKYKGKGKSDTRYCHCCGEQGHFGVNCPHKWTNSMDEEED